MVVERLSLRIRHAEETDLPALEWEGRFTHFRRLYQRAMEESKKGRSLLLVADFEGSIVGQIFIQFRGDPSASGCRTSSGYLYSFRVRPSFRNQGVGTHLMRRAEKELKQRGFKRASIAVAKENEGALRLYERLGYRLVAEDPGQWSYIDHEGCLRHVSEPAYVLIKQLTE